MRRFNLLLVNSDVHSGHQIVKFLYKVFKSNFVFEVDSMEEGQRLLRKLNIDMIMVDLDNEHTDLSEIQENHPETLLFAIYTRNLGDTVFTNDNITLIRKDALSTDFLAELKLIKKARENGAQYQSRFNNASFTNYGNLVQGGAN